MLMLNAKCFHIYFAFHVLSVISMKQFGKYSNLETASCSSFLWLFLVLNVMLQ